MRESFTNQVTIFDVKPNVMDVLIEFCYTGVAFICENNAVDVLKAADLFQVILMSVLILLDALLKMINTFNI